MNVLKDILEGWSRQINQGQMSEEEKKLAQDRIEVCVKCENFTPVRTCTQCGCFMPAKTKVTTAVCPINKW